MRRVDIFVSSPPDVQKERSVVERLIRSVAVEFNVSVTVSYSNHLRKPHPSDQIAAGSANGIPQGHSLLCPCFWEYQNSDPEQTYEERIPNTGQYDLVICILWSRLGTKLSPAFVLPEGNQPTSATEYEIGWALDQVKRTPGFPELHLYRNMSAPAAPLEPKGKRETFFRQWDSVQEFFASWRNKSGFLEACSEYRDLREFEDLFRPHFRDFVAKQLRREIVPRKPANNPHYWKGNPFRGLQFFDVEDALVFHGRTKAIGEVLDALKKQAGGTGPIVLVLGPSGSGKSSLVRAGVLPYLTEAGSTDGPWRRAIARPGPGSSAEEPFNRLSAALLEEAALPELQTGGEPHDVTSLASELHQNPQNAARRITELLDRASLQELGRFGDEEPCKSELSGGIANDELARHRKLVRIPTRAHLALVVDSLEELFTGSYSPEIQHRYIAALLTLIRSKRVFIVATLQSDYYASYQQFPELIEVTEFAGRYDVRPPVPEELADMIRRPAEAAGLSFELDRAKGKSLDQAILKVAVSSAEALPLLEHLLSELYRKQAARQDGLLRWSDYIELGGFEGALAKHAEALFTSLENDVQGSFGFVMSKLVSFGNSDQGVRRTVLYRDIISPAGPERRHPQGAQAFVDLFVKEGLLDTEPELTPGRTIRLGHQVLLRKWPRAQAWLAENQAFLRIKDRLEAALTFSNREPGKPGNSPVSSLGAADAETLLRHFRSSLSKTQIDYLDKILARQQQGRRLREIIWVAVGVALTLGAGFAGLRWNDIEAQKKNTEELARIDRRIAEIAIASRAQQRHEPVAVPEKESSQTEQTSAERSSETASENREPKQNQEDRRLAESAQVNPTPNIAPVLIDPGQPKPALTDPNQNTNPPSDTKEADSPGPAASEATTDGTTSEAELLKSFVIDYLQTVASDDVSTQERFFARKVTYFDEGVISLRRVQAAKESYNREWPTREWKPQGEAEIHETNNPKVHEIIQPYTWTTTDGSKLDEGSGTLYLRVYRNSKGEFHIVHIERRD